MRLSFRTKVVTLMTFGIIILFLVIGVIFSITRTNELKRAIISEANMFVQLTRNQIGDAYNRYYETAFFIFRENVRRQLGLSLDIKNIQIVSLDNKIYYESSSDEQEKFFITRGHPVVTDPFVLQNIKKMEIHQKIEKDLKIIAPYINEYGAHNFSIVYTFSLERLNKGIGSLHRNTLFLAIGIILIGFIISSLLANRITSHLINLSNAAKKVGSGDFSQVVDIKTNDEFEEVARAFNFMSSEIRSYVRDLKNMVRELKKRDKEKTQFLASVSHELRTPLTASLGYVDYMEKGKLGSITKEQAHSLAIIKRNLERLTKEIRSLLDISKYTLGGVKLKLATVSIPKFLEPILTDFHPDIEMKKLKVNLNYTGKFNSVLGDKDYLKTVFENIIGNAIKFSPIGSEINIEITDHIEKNKKFVCFKITDQGPIIPKKKLEKIFEPFYQVDSSAKKIHGGIGLGLSIARVIIEAHKGKIWAEADNEISIFKFIIPYGGKDGSS
jgi:signal transduction histidine kinase